MLKQQLVHTLNEESEEEGDEEFSAIIASINPLHLRDLALTTRRKLYTDLLPETSCVVATPPQTGFFNIVYEVSFSDGIKWAIRVPARGDVFSASRARTLHLDIVTQRFISSKTSMPIPRIYDWSLDSHNVLSYPFVIMDFIPGTNLSKLWNDKSWITDLKRERIFEQIAGWMTELAALEFDQIGRLDWDGTSGMHRVVPFPDESALMRDVRGYKEPDNPVPAGPFHTALSYLSFLLSIRRHTSDTPMLAVLQLFLSALTDSKLDGPPFVLSHPDFDSQNVLVDDDGTITGIIDWDNVNIHPRQGGAAAYPMWLTVDWDPLFYGWSKDASPEDNADYDSPAELATYRRAYLDAITRVSRGQLTHITRNSHIWTTLYIAVSNGIATSGIVDHLSTFVFGSSLLGYEVEEGIEGGAWYALGQAPGTIAEITGTLQHLHLCSSIYISL
ncbi:kinase-like domain-containing protein [Hysterangium stoloniferum]|nr:kinase-like domain-containing protein [Hysterangium stoloniferum]